MTIDERGFLDLEVVASEAIGIGNPGDLEVRVYGSKLLVSSSLYNALEASSINLFRASDLFLFFQEAPDEIGGVLGWNQGYVRYAHWQLAHQLSGHIAAEYISFPQRDPEEPLPELSYVVSGRRERQ